MLRAEIKPAIWNDGRTDSVAAIHLQRLANPLIPYNAASNPYRTIDSMPIDLTAFNGIDPTERENSESPLGLATRMTRRDNAKSEVYARQRGANTTSTERLMDPRAVWTCTRRRTFCPHDKHHRRRPPIFTRSAEPHWAS